jgi:hypothetical protein
MVIVITAIKCRPSAKGKLLPREPCSYQQQCPAKLKDEAMDMRAGEVGS